MAHPPTPPPPVLNQNEKRGWIRITIVVVLIAVLATVWNCWRSPSASPAGTQTATASAPATAQATTVKPADVKVTPPVSCKTVEAKEGSFTITAEKDRCDVYCLPEMKINWESVDPQGRYKVKTQTGSEFSFTPEKSDKVTETVKQACFTALGDKPEKIEITITKP